MATLHIRPDIRERYASLFGARNANGRTLVVEDLIAARPGAGTPVRRVRLPRPERGRRQLDLAGAIKIAGTRESTRDSRGFLRSHPAHI